MELSSLAPAPPAPLLPPQLSPGYQPPQPPQIQPPAATPTSTPPVPGGDQPIGLPRDTTVPLLPQPPQPTTPQPPAPQQTASIQTDLVRDPTGRNNPGNIRIPGATGPAGFQTYPTMQDGMRALQNNLLNYQDQRGLNTIAGIISTWAPPNENNTEELIKKAEASMGIDRNQRIDLHDPATMARMTNVILAQEQSGRGGSGPGGMKLPQPQQRMLTPERRDSPDWGHPAPVSGDMPGATPPESEWAKVLNTVSPLLLAIGSIALRLPLSSAITAYGAMSRAQYNGQKDEYERSRTHFQDKLNESNAQQALESKEASDAFDTYGQNNPQGLQQRLMQIALTYNDPILYTTAAKGDLNTAYKLQADRDLHNQSLTKVNDAVRKQREDEAQDAAVAAMDNKWHDDFVAKNGREPTADETAIAHNEHIGEAGRAGTKDPKGAGSTVEAPLYSVMKDGKDTGTRVRLGKSGGYVNAATNQPWQPGPGETVEETPRGKEGGDKPEQEGEVKNVLGPDGKRTGQQVREGKQGGYFDPNTKEPVQLKQGETIETKDPAADKLSEPRFYDVVKDGKVQRTVQLRDRKSGPGFEYAQTGEPFQTGPGEQLMPHTERAGTGPHFGTIDDLMNRWHEQFVKDNNREPTTDEISKQRQTFTQETKPAPMSARQVSQRLGIAIGEAAGGVAALTQLSSSATLGPWGGAQAALTTGVYDNFLRSLTNKVTPREARMMNSIAKVIARPLASLEAAGVATGLVGVTQSLQTEFPQSGDDGYTVLTKLANIRNIVDAAEDMLARDKNLDPEIKKLIADNRAKVDEAIPYNLHDVVGAEVSPTKENMRGLAERLLHHGTAQSGNTHPDLPPGVTYHENP